MEKVSWTCKLVTLAALSLAFGMGDVSGIEAAELSPQANAQDIFARRIMPILNSPNPSSCTQCHLAGVDLKNYILPSSEKTFLSLRDQGLIDLEKPENSKILRLINMGDNPGAQLIQQSVRQQEYEAFSEWIKASCRDSKLKDAPPLVAGDLALAKRPVEVIRHARMDRVLESFNVNVWSQRQRCLYCHSGTGGGNPKLVAEHGEEITWMKNSAEETLTFLLASRLINSNQPAKSLLLLKPINQVKHAGGQKMLVGDMAYKGFRAWLDDYGRTVSDQYAKPADLPQDISLLTFGSSHRLQISATLPSWADKMLQVNVYPWDSEKGAWEADPIATSDRAVWGEGRIWAHELWLLAYRESERAKSWQTGRPLLAQGRYLIRAFLDSEGKLQRDWKAVLGPTEFIGETEITTDWPEGRATVIEASQLKR